MRTILTLALGFLLPALAFGEEAQLSANQCQMPRPIPILVCEEGGNFLCVNTPLGGVKEDFVVIKGRLNLENTSLGSFSVSLQQEYTRDITSIQLTPPLKENCWEQNLSGQTNFCLEDGGKYSVYIPLSELGPYTVFVAASRVQGSSMQATVRTSRVIAPTFTSDAVTYDPNILNASLGADVSHVRVTFDLLKGCGETREACDFIGAATGGVFVSVQNQIQNSTLRQIRCETNVVEGEAGQFAIGVPVLAGTNQLTLTVCNAATGLDKGHCPKIETPSFTVQGTPPKVEILPPLSNGPLLWDSSLTSTVPLRFRISGHLLETCDDSVKVSFNLDAPQKVCANSEGIFELRLQPQEGYNMGLIEANLPNEHLVETFTFGVGKILSPFDSNGNLKGEGERRLSSAIQFGLPKSFFNETVLPRFEKYLDSDAFKNFLKDWSEEAGRGEVAGGPDPLAQEKQALLDDLPYCPKEGAIANLRIKIMEPPQIGRVAIEPLKFLNQKIEAKVTLQDFSLHLQLYKDANGDGRPDIDPLPLKVAFNRVTLNPVLAIERKTAHSFLVKFSSSHTDCDYKRSGACLSLPALLTPQAFEGAANDAGAFVTCDHSQGVSGEMEEICHDLNVVDRQTGGVIQEKILDVLNKTYACDGSASLTAFLQKGIPFEDKADLFSVAGKVGADEIKIDENGISVSLFTLFGSDSLFRHWPSDFQKRGAGILISSPANVLSGLSSGEEGVSFDISLPLVSQLFWGLTSKNGGGFSLDLDEDFFRAQGFDFERECQMQTGGESEEAQNPLCHLRPRAREILGSPITDYGYLKATDPVTLTLTPSLAFPLRAAVLDSQGKLRLELADWGLTVSSKENPLITAKLSLKLTVQTSSPLLTAEDPNDFQMPLKILPQESFVRLVPLEETNRTVIPGDVLLANLEEILKFAIDHFSQEGNEIKIKIPRFPNLVKGLTFGPEGFDLNWDPQSDSLSIKTSLFFSP